MYEIRYRDLKSNKKRTFVVEATSLTDADDKMRRVHEEELNTSIIIKYSKLINKSAA